MAAAEPAALPETALIDIRILSNVTSRSIPALERDDAAGRIPRPIRIGRSKRWRRHEIMNWISAGCPPRKEWEAMSRKNRTG
jgi:predicted DNA-binding transcriptional regulator AlpA